MKVRFAVCPRTQGNYTLGKQIASPALPLTSPFLSLLSLLCWTDLCLAQRKTHFSPIARPLLLPNLSLHHHCATLVWWVIMTEQRKRVLAHWSLVGLSFLLWTFIDACYLSFLHSIFVVVSGETHWEWACEICLLASTVSHWSQSCPENGGKPALRVCCFSIFFLSPGIFLRNISWFQTQSPTMRKHGWQLPYHPLQVSLHLIFLHFFIFFFSVSLVFSEMWTAVWVEMCVIAGGSCCCVSGTGVCFLCVLCPFCWEAIVSIHCDGDLHSSCKYNCKSLIQDSCFCSSQL